MNFRTGTGGTGGEGRHFLVDPTLQDRERAKKEAEAIEAEDLFNIV